jgi:cytochrome c oxidase assembly factor CtaG
MNLTQRLYLGLAIVLALAVTITPIGFRALEVFTFHMIQHITLLMVVGSLLVLATTQTLRTKLNSNKIFRALTSPWISFGLYAVMMIGVHLPVVHLFIMHNSWAHYFVEVPLYLTVPYLFYFNILESNLVERRLSTAMSVILLWLMMVPETLTGFFIYISHESAYEYMYDINDQRLGGTIMWSGGMIIDVIWIMLAVYHWWKSEELKSQNL